MTGGAAPTVAVIGPGAIGLLAAAAIERAGHARPVLCGRRPLPAVSVRFPSGPHRLSAPVLTAPQELDGAAADLVVLAVKAHQSAGAAAWLSATRGKRTPVLVLQNGVEHTERLTGLVPPDLVVPGIVWSTVEMVAPDLAVVRPGDDAIEVPASSPEVVDAVFDRGPVAVRAVEDFTTAAWTKLIYNAAVAVEPLTLRRSEVFADTGIRELTHRLAAECSAVAVAAGARLPADFADQVITRLSAVPAEHGTSILYDRLAGRPMEWDARNGVIRRYGARLGVPTPISDILVPLLAAAGPVPSPGRST